MKFTGMLLSLMWNGIKVGFILIWELIKLAWPIWVAIIVIAIISGITSRHGSD